MSKELVISANRHETRVAIIEDDQVVEVYHQRENEYSLAGSIHKGRVTRVLPGMQSAFVDIGLDRDAFLYVSDFFEDNEEYDKIVTSVEEKVLKLDRPLPVPVAALPPVAGPPAEVQEPVEVRSASPEAGPPMVEASAPAAPPAPLSGPTQDQRRDDRERRGRRSRRRRGQKGGGGRLPDSKYYSPGARTAPEHEPEVRSIPPEPATPSAPPVPAPAIAREEPADDFFVLPGESLAKYTRPGYEEEDEEPQGEAAPEPGIEEAEEHFEAEREPVAHERDRGLPRHTAGELTGGQTAAASEAAVETGSGIAGESAFEAQLELASEGVMPVTVSEILAEPPAEPQPELAAALEEVQQEALDEGGSPAARPPALPDSESHPEDVLTAEADSAETAEDMDVVPTDAAEPEAPESAEAAEGPAQDLAAEKVGGEETEPAELGEPGEGGEAIVEPEGPEPARIPTSLTAALREQNPRYLHRVSRRMRRRGRDGRGGPMGDAPRGPQPGSGPAGPPEPRPQDAGPRNVPELRTAPAPVSVSAPAPPAPRPDKAGAPSISDLLREGQEIIVQIAKEPLGQKGARITSHIALPGRFLVYMPTVDHIGVSRKIPSDEERSRLKRVLQSNRTGISGGYIVRTAGEGRTEEELRADMMFLYNMWLDMRQKAERRPAPLLIHHDLNVVERVLRDQLTSAFKSIWVDNEEVYESVLRFVQRFQPPLVNRVKMYTRQTPIFEEFNITGELEKALRPKVWLKSGGYIVINQTEALVAIDVNTGKFVGKSNRLEDTIVKTNTDAIKEIVRQIRLRDLGGIIVVDFIDMDERKNRQKVMQALEEAMRADRAPYKILQFNDFGLVAITRKRVKQSLERTLCTPCPYCEGAGYVKSAQTVVGEILQEAHKISRHVEGKDVMLRVAPDVAKVLKSNQNTFLQELEEILGRTVMIKSDGQLHLEKFDLA
ncbi:MAG TPA: Rne/Rng family ribonuclease [Bryobacteraceae bacterium]|nr:Rne/Rng family ribonuclease [Bryobacteraceae bacterium]